MYNDLKFISVDMEAINRMEIVNLVKNERVTNVLDCLAKENVRNFRKFIFCHIKRSFMEQ